MSRLRSARPASRSTRETPTRNRGGSAAKHGGCPLPSERLEVLDQIPLVLVAQVQAEPVLVTLHDVEPRLEPSVVVEPALVLGLHEESPLTNEDAGEVHRAVGVIRGAVRRRGWTGPQRARRHSRATRAGRLRTRDERRNGEDCYEDRREAKLLHHNALLPLASPECGSRGLPCRVDDPASQLDTYLWTCAASDVTRRALRLACTRPCVTTSAARASFCGRRRPGRLAAVKPDAIDRAISRRRPPRVPPRSRS